MIAYGLAVFVWLQLEDNAVLPVTLFACAGAVLFVLRWGAHRVGQRDTTQRIIGAGLLGALAGVGTALLAVFLMLIKTGLHSHAFPDYPPAQMIAVLERAPVWAAAGALVGIGVVVARKSLRQSGGDVVERDDSESALYVEESET